MNSNNNSSPDSGFIPRKEFIKQIRIPHTFALLAVSDSGLLRLYSFPLAVVSSLNRFFEERNLQISFREDADLKFTEFGLNGKPWAKSIGSDKLLVDVITLIYQHGHVLLSTLDYGQESDDRLVMAFTKPDPATYQPLNVIASGSSSNHPVQHKSIFALSFASGTILRVINPPLNLTPAILHSVRASWPRGVVSEKSCDGFYEFKLRGYRWLDEDTFPTDSLHQILTLLSSLDTYAFTLVASLTISKRSRFKDLWIFTGPSSSDHGFAPDSPAASFDSHGQELRKVVTMPEPNPYLHLPDEPAKSNQHRRFATAPAPAPAAKPAFPQPQPYQAPKQSHTRASSESTRSKAVPPSAPLTRTQAAFLRKAAPRAQVPVSVTVEGLEDRENVGPANVDPNNVEGVAGVGPISPAHRQAIIYTTPPADLNQTAMSMPPQSRNDSPQIETSETLSPTRPESPPPSAPLLGSKVFGVGSSILRDSAYEENGGVGDVLSCEVPITLRSLKSEGNGGQTENDPRPDLDQQASTGPVLPGGWKGSPELEEIGQEVDVNPSQEEVVVTPVLDVDARVRAPEVRHADVRSNISQVGIMDVISSEPPPPLPITTNDNERQAETSGKDKGKEVDRIKHKERENGRKDKRDGPNQGWVLVTVESRSQLSEKSSGSPRSPDRTMNSKASSSNANGALAALLPTQEASMSAAAKTIAIVDALGAQSKSDSSDGTPRKSGGITRLFSLRRSPTSSPTSSPTPPSQPFVNQGKDETEKETAKKVTLGSKLRRLSPLSSAKTKGPTIQ